ncbi:Uncharacterised protein [Mycobacteroides abscessus subsp. massiliense]|nr:Uncharacterised protein [Mycobacteroides abscessus subsp. massiliense]
MTGLPTTMNGGGAVNITVASVGGWVEADEGVNVRNRAGLHFGHFDEVDSH